MESFDVPCSGSCSENPKDEVAWHPLMKATERLDSGVPQNWTGVTVMASK